MDTITQIALFRQSVVTFSFRNSVQSTINRFNISRATLYRWRKKYDGTPKSLLDKSKRPHHHPNQHTSQELKLISDMRKRNNHLGLVVFWVKLRQRGYSRSITSLWRVLQRLHLIPIKPPNPKYVAKPYENMSFPGERIQIDVKIVPKSCITGDAKALNESFFQYTAIDEYSRFRYIEAFKEHNTYSSAVFLEHVLKVFKFKVHCVQTDNGLEFIKSFDDHKQGKLSLFEKLLLKHGIKHKLIRPYTPRHNGKVERSHRKDNEYFYAVHKFYSFEDFKKQLAFRNREYNNFPIRPLNWNTPAQYIKDFLSDGLLH